MANIKTAVKVLPLAICNKRPHIIAAAPQLYKDRLLGCTHLFSPGYWTEPSAVHDGPPHLIITTDESCGRGSVRTWN